MFTSTILRAGLGLLASTRLVAAESLNLTLTFYPDEDNTCSGDDSKAISFSTSSYPLVQSCFNLDEIFANNSTGGVRNSSSTSTSDRGLRWVITNSEAWDPNGNYSHVKYEQLDPTGRDDDDDGEITWSSRRVNIYNGDDCLQASSPDDEEELLPWFSWTCHSSEDDHCRTVPYDIKSFFILPLDDDDMDGKCLDFALYGASARSLPHTLGALVTTMVVGFFLL
ncbi:hypothetical protein EKO27_g8989 [Xylaria grammica]|uniref:Autophagy-related protein 27 n=1 Tax=Xylaria grammica TaxID=363999 RepID=A0A439CV98_9PEZI|nr:hypothetical protein EKO27_g8989 [Xylaria grammica]